MSKLKILGPMDKSGFTPFVKLIAKPSILICLKTGILLPVKHPHIPLTLGYNGTSEDH
jgi:hypothetical protein